MIFFPHSREYLKPKIWNWKLCMKYLPHSGGSKAELQLNDSCGQEESHLKDAFNAMIWWWFWSRMSRQLFSWLFWLICGHKWVKIQMGYGGHYVGFVQEWLRAGEGSLPLRIPAWEEGKHDWPTEENWTFQGKSLISSYPSLLSQRFHHL